MRLSVIIPCYNEAKNIKTLVKRCSKILSFNEIEIIFVNNGSTDNSSSILKKELLLKSNCRIKTVKVNKGYGHGILSGLKIAKGEILAWTHADLQTDPNDILKAFKIFKQNPNERLLFVKGSRKGRSFYNLIFTWGMSLIGLIFFQKFMSDINGQPTMFHRSFYENWNDPPSDFSLDLYVYYLALKKKLVIKKIPVFFNNREFGIGHNETLKSKLNYSFRTISYMLNLIRKHNFKFK